MALFGKKQKSEDPIEEGIPTKDLYQEGMVTLQDIIAPSALEITATHIRLGKKIARTYFVFNYPKTLSSNWFAPIINLDTLFDIAMFIHPIDSSIALKNLRTKISQVESQVVSREEKGLVRDPLLEAA